MSEDDLIAVDHKLAELQRRRARYVKSLAELDPNRNADAFDVVLKRIDELNTALIRVSSLQARSRHDAPAPDPGYKPLTAK